LYNNTTEEWVLVAFCRLRGDFRHFRLDRIQKITTLDSTFPPHSLTIEQYLKKYDFLHRNP
jgi:predicted DNA-binding transcriptional regulator YafY